VVAKAVERLTPVDHEASRNAEAQAQRRARVGVEEEQLAPPARHGERVADQGGAEPRRRGPTPAVAGVHHPRPGDPPAERLLREGPVELDFEDLGHGGKVSDRWCPARIWWTNAS